MPLDLTAFLNADLLFGLKVGNVVSFLAVMLLGYVFSAVVNRLIKRADRSLEKGSFYHAFFEAAHGPVKWAIFVATLWVAVFAAKAATTDLSQLGSNTSDAIWQLVTRIASPGERAWFLLTEVPFAIWYLSRLIDKLTLLWSAKAAETADTFDDQLVPVVRQGSKLFIYILGGLTMAQAAGWNVTSLLAGVGIGGAAIALASKDTIANVFGSVVVFVDRPFQVGDWVEISGQEGTVEEVGLRTTRIRTFANSVITLPNSTLTTSAINNWSRMKKRRIKLTIGVTYDSKAEQMEQAVKALREVLRNDDRIMQDFYLVNFNNFGPSSLDIFIYAFTKTTRWDQYMQVREEILIEFMKAIQGLGLSFAFPTQSLHIESLPQMPGQAGVGGGRGPLEAPDLPQ